MYCARILIIFLMLFQIGKNAAREWAQTATKIIKPHSNEALRYAAADNSVNTAGVIDDDVYKDLAGMCGKQMPIEINVMIGYGSDRYPKLQALKRKYDATNLFKNNVNIAPQELYIPN